MILSPRGHGLAASVRGGMTVWPFLTCLCPHTHITGNAPLDCSCVSLLAPVSGSPHCLWPLLQSSAHWDPVGRPSVGFTPAPRENSVCSFEKLWALLLMHTRALPRNPPSGHPLDLSLPPRGTAASDCRAPAKAHQGNLASTLSGVDASLGSSPFHPQVPDPVEVP